MYKLAPNVLAAHRSIAGANAISRFGCSDLNNHYDLALAYLF